MTARTINVPLDEDLVQRVRVAEAGPAGLSDAAAIERIVARHLAHKALREAQAMSTVDENEANQVVLEELHAMRRERARDHAA